MHRSTAHLHEPSIRRLGEPVGLRGIHSDKDAALTAGRYRHVACDEECEPAEHLSLCQVWLPSQQLANALRDVLVIGHGTSYGRSATDLQGAHRPDSTTPEPNQAQARRKTGVRMGLRDVEKTCSYSNLAVLRLRLNDVARAADET